MGAPVISFATYMTPFSIYHSFNSANEYLVIRPSSKVFATYRGYCFVPADAYSTVLLDELRETDLEHNAIIMKIRSKIAIIFISLNDLLKSWGFHIDISSNYTIGLLL